MKKSYYLVVFAALVAVAAGVLFRAQSPAIAPVLTLNKNEAGTRQASSLATANTGHAVAGANTSDWQASPFELAAATSEAPAIMLKNSTQPSLAEAPEKEEISPQEAARRKKMEQLGYMVPPDYYTKDLKSLRKMAKAGDAFAMVHIGEKYAFELNGQKDHPEFEPGMNYPEAAKQAFKQALVAGNIRSAGIISELYFNENNALESYAWHIVSEQMGDSISADWFRLNDMSKNASQELKNAAAARATQIVAELTILRKK